MKAALVKSKMMPSLKDISIACPWIELLIHCFQRLIQPFILKSGKEKFKIFHPHARYAYGNQKSYSEYLCAIKSTYTNHKNISTSFPRNTGKWWGLWTQKSAWYWVWYKWTWEGEVANFSLEQCGALALYELMLPTYETYNTLENQYLNLNC